MTGAQPRLRARYSQCGHKFIAANFSLNFKYIQCCIGITEHAAAGNYLKRGGSGSDVEHCGRGNGLHLRSRVEPRLGSACALQYAVQIESYSVYSRE